MKTKREVRFFNTTGPCNPLDHYMLPPEDRLVGAQLHRYIGDELYWVLHAPRQTGKTTFLKSWMREINAGDEALACYVSVERCQGIPDIERSMPAIYDAICANVKAENLPVPEIKGLNPASLLHETLAEWAKLASPKPLVVLFDEVDVLEGETMISFLRQLRDGFALRGVGLFPVSIALVGMRDLKDYITASKGGVPPNPGSPFNIKADSVVLGNFTKNDVINLFAQHTAETGRQITQEALDYVWEQSQGQPWIVNNLFMRATMRVLDRDSTETVTIEHIREARQQMITARETHLDALGKRLSDPRVKRVVQTVITGNSDPPLGRTENDVELTLDMGLITWNTQKGFIISNPIYEEILIRYLNSPYHDSTPPPSSWQWQKPDGSLDMDRLLKEFQKFWRRNSEIWEERADYTEAFPHLLLMAFLQRITNGDGDIVREAAAGRGRMDLAVEYEKKWFIIEIKLIHSYDTPKTVLKEGLEQILFYRDCSHPEAPAYLVIFDRRPETKQKPWEERLHWEEVDGITIVKC
ncbi:MAG: PD-(D/E)XK nuclease domain-containing protein [Tannerella sp.]|nr:PD-(D/E)XK nuclease domain-containing protein [Tannerella sp.]